MRQLQVPNSFEVNQFYTNDQIYYALEIANLGGLRPKLDANKNLDFIVLITSTEENKNAVRNPYADRIEGNILTYTGAGLSGEQNIVGTNKRLLEQINNPVPILGFVKEGINKYRYIGFLLLLRYFEDYQLDREGSMRKVWIFEFQIISDITSINVGEFNEVFLPLFTKYKSEIIDGDTRVYSDASILDSEVKIDELKDVEILKSNLMTINPYQFENMMGGLVTSIGFSDVKVTKKSGDEGVDIFATMKNPLSVNLQFLFQVKRWQHSVGRNEVANLRGSMGLNNQGVIIATSHFTSSAINEANSENKTPICLVGVKELYSIINTYKFSVNQYIDKSI